MYVSELCAQETLIPGFLAGLLKLLWKNYYVAAATLLLPDIPGFEERGHVDIFFLFERKKSI